MQHQHDAVLYARVLGCAEMPCCFRYLIIYWLLPVTTADDQQQQHVWCSLCSFFADAAHWLHRVQLLLLLLLLI